MVEKFLIKIFNSFELNHYKYIFKYLNILELICNTFAYTTVFNYQFIVEFFCMKISLNLLLSIKIAIMKMVEM